MPTSSPAVLVVGAGPTGLCLAIWLKTLRPALSLRVVDKAPMHGTSSRAIVIHARTLEYYAQLGLADKIIAAGKVLDSVSIATDGAVRGMLKFGPAMGVGTGGIVLTKFPFVLTLPQDVHEEILLQHFQELGGEVEWGVEVAGISAQKAGGTVEVRLRTTLEGGKGEVVEGVDESVTVTFLAGCDGARSAVRKLMDIEMHGDRFPTRFYVADTILSSVQTAMTGLRLSLSSKLFGAALPLGSEGEGQRLRVLGMVPTDVPEESKFEEFQDRIEKLNGVKIKTVEWSSIYSVYHRVAATFRTGRVFLLGDAAHIHSPVGGQGMNTGLGDAANLAWKLVAALESNTDLSLLETYNNERREFAKKLVNTTDRVFHLLIKDGWFGLFLRKVVFANLVPLLWKLWFVPRRVFLVVSQLGVSYRQSVPAERQHGQGYQGKLRIGDRLPWTGSAGVDNHASLETLSYQTHRYKASQSSESEADHTADTPMRIFTVPDPSIFGFDPASDYLIRPDGYIGAITLQQS